MTTRTLPCLVTGLMGCFLCALSVNAADPAVPVTAKTRPEMKQQLEDLKQRTARLELPPLSAEELAAGRSSVNNGRLRAMYLPPSWQGFVISGWGGSSNRQRPASTTSVLNSLQSRPDYGFKTRLFWIVSRGNDCQYCLGHQELKLRRAGMTEDQIAALDSRWDLFPAAEQAAIELAYQMTMAPHKVTAADAAKLKEFYSDREVIDIVYTVARYNSVNRWTDSTGIPQDRSFGGEEHTELTTPTSAEFANAPSKVAPLNVEPRPEWESLEHVLDQLAAIRQRTPAVELPTPQAAEAVLFADTPGVIPPKWFQAMADLSVALDAWRQRQAMVRDGRTDPLLRAQIAWISARENRAWYSMGHARVRLLAVGGEPATLTSFAALEQAATQPGHAEALRFARKLTATPHLMADADVARLKENFSDYEIAEIIQLVCDANAFDRFTEVLQLPLEF
ncbi:hypothetical protein GC163_14810 [bacterium]|nr:hypothetical protein [bacterium]